MQEGPWAALVADELVRTQGNFNSLTFIKFKSACDVKFQTSGVGNLLPTSICLLWDVESGRQGLPPSTSRPQLSAVCIHLSSGRENRAEQTAPGRLTLRAQAWSEMALTGAAFSCDPTLFSQELDK